MTQIGQIFTDKTDKISVNLAKSVSSVFQYDGSKFL